MPVKPPPSAGVKGAWLAIAITAVAAFEGLYTHAYKDVVGVTTICYGVTNADRPVHMGDTATVTECKEMLGEDLQRYNEQVKKCIPSIDSFPPHRHAAIVSFEYNVGQGNLCKSSVARKLNAGDVVGGCNALMAWNRAGGREIRGLTTRRAAERKECLRSD
jgi:lysozyme